VVRTAAVASLLAGACLAPAGPAAAAAPSASLTKWNRIDGAAFAGSRLVALDVETVRVRRGPRVALTYHSVVAVGVELASRRTRFARNAFSTAVAIRTSIGSMAGARLAAAGADDWVVVPGGRGFAPPVVWCCGDGDREVVVVSDGRPDAPVPVAAGVDGPRVRALLRVADGSTLLVSAGPRALGDPDAPDGTRTEAVVSGTPGRGTSALAAGVVAWTDDPAAGVLRVAVPDDAGVRDERTVAVGGRVLGVWADAGEVAVAVRRGARVAVLRLPAGAATAVTAWTGTRVPRVALGGGTLAVGDGRAVLASRSGRVRRTATARGPVAAVAADGDRVAWFERISRRGPDGVARRTVARLARVAP